MVDDDEWRDDNDERGHGGTIVSAPCLVRRYDKYREYHPCSYRARFEHGQAGSATTTCPYVDRGHTARGHFFLVNFRTFGRKSRCSSHRIGGERQFSGETGFSGYGFDGFRALVTAYLAARTQFTHKHKHCGFSTPRPPLPRPLTCVANQRRPGTNWKQYDAHNFTHDHYSLLFRSLFRCPFRVRFRSFYAVLTTSVRQQQVTL